MRLPTLVLIATLALPAMPVVASSPLPSPLTVTLSPAQDNPVRPQMGDRLLFHGVIRNGGSTPTAGVIGWMTLIRVDPEHEQAVDLEDWSAQKAVTAARLAPGGTIETDWPMRLIQAGHYRIAVSAVARGSDEAVVSSFVSFSVRDKPVVESKRVLPVALGFPVVLFSAVVMKHLTRRKHRRV